MRHPIISGLALAAFFGLASPAMAVEAESSTWLNVRSGPGVNFGVVGVLEPGEAVQATDCTTNRWCRVRSARLDGWASSNLLTAPSGSGCELGFAGGAGSTDLTLDCGTATVAPARVQEAQPAAGPATGGPEGDLACFYTEPNFSGPQVCSGVATITQMNVVFDDKISSVRLFGAAQVRLCTGQALGGTCWNQDRDVANLDPAIDDRASSAAIFTGAWTGEGAGN